MGSLSTHSVEPIFEEGEPTSLFLPGLVSSLVVPKLAPPVTSGVFSLDLYESVSLPLLLEYSVFPTDSAILCRNFSAMVSKYFFQSSCSLVHSPAFRFWRFLANVSLEYLNLLLCLFRWFKFTLKPPNSMARGNFFLAIWDTSHWNFFVKFGLKTPYDIS